MDPKPQRRPRLLVIEPDSLTKWSIQSYFQGKFEILFSESVAAACDLLKSTPADAVVVADSMAADEIAELEQIARVANAEVRIVRTVTSSLLEPKTNERTVRLEKPFKLSSLAKLLEAVEG